MAEEKKDYYCLFIYGEVQRTLSLSAFKKKKGFFMSLMNVIELLVRELG